MGQQIHEKGTISIQKHKNEFIRKKSGEKKRGRHVEEQNIRQRKNKKTNGEEKIEEKQKEDRDGTV